MISTKYCSATEIPSLQILCYRHIGYRQIQLFFSENEYCVALILNELFTLQASDILGSLTGIIIKINKLGIL